MGMKKGVLAALAIVCVVSLAACGKPKVSDKAASSARTAVETVDRFLDNAITLGITQETFNGLYYEMSDHIAANTDNESDDVIFSDISDLNLTFGVLTAGDVTFAECGLSADEHQQILQQRNQLVQDAGLEKEFGARAE